MMRQVKSPQRARARSPPQKSRSPATKAQSPRTPVQKSRSPATKAQSPQTPVQKSRSPATKATSPVQKVQSPRSPPQKSRSPATKATSPRTPPQKSRSPATKATSPRTPPQKSRSPATKAQAAAAQRNLSPVKFNNIVAEFVSLLFNSATQAHIFHLQTKSFARHKALNAYYDAVVPIGDKYAEAYQGKYGIITRYDESGRYLEGDAPILTYFEALEGHLVALQTRLPKDEDLVNTFAEALDLVHSTRYLLTQLS
jgi:hypothetical protein